MIDQSTPGQIITRQITIYAPTARVWEALTNPVLMQKWMSEEAIIITADWKAGGAFTIQGVLHGTAFENNGTVLQFEPERALQYDYLSSISGLPDNPENYTIIGFELEGTHDQTLLTFTARQFPTDIIYKHVAFYWNGTLGVLKQFIERSSANSEIPVS